MEPTVTISLSDYRELLEFKENILSGKTARKHVFFFGVYFTYIEHDKMDDFIKNKCNNLGAMIDKLMSRNLWQRIINKKVIA